MHRIHRLKLGGDCHLLGLTLDMGVLCIRCGCCIATEVEYGF
jgi:hypothetical protein